MSRRALHPTVFAAIAVASALGFGTTAGAASPRCSSLHLQGATVAKAKQRAGHAGCELSLRGAKVTTAGVQTIARTRTRGATITAWVNALCRAMGAPGPGIAEPTVTPGPTELVSGLFLDGGPLERVSAPDCSKIHGTPLGGTIAVRNSAGAVVSTQTVAEGHFATFALSPGTYAVAGTFANARRDEKPIESLPRSVTITAGNTVRADVVVGIP
jgi:hypothetical protein